VVGLRAAEQNNTRRNLADAWPRQFGGQKNNILNGQSMRSYAQLGDHAS
jgi:hypothetical protein